MNSFIESQFSHCPLLWMFCCSRRLNNRINHIQERGLRIVYRDYTSSFEDLLRKNGTVTVHQRNIQQVAVEMFKAKYGMGSSMMKDIFKFNVNSRKSTFLIPNPNTEFMGKLSLRYFGAVVWERLLPERFKAITLIEKFKEEIKSWIPSNCPCRLCKNYVTSVGFIETFE